MKTNKIFKAATLLAVMSIGMTSCNDWLTIPPQDYIVEENFWEDKNDLEGVRYGVYQNMRGHVDKFIIWGDLRSDAYKLVLHVKTIVISSRLILIQLGHIMIGVLFTTLLVIVTRFFLMVTRF